ncbi:MAG: flagellar hook-associated protein FlgK [Planctomycetes bacterium]|nr:flagellar hook-associated protein FlgK [Planctomycetota bacterium]
MGLFSAFEIGKNAVVAQQRALQTVGNNIANANTEGYSRQRVRLETINSFRNGSFFQGLGVGLKGVERVHDLAIEARLRDAGSRSGALARQQVVYGRIETAFDALSDRALGVRLSEFHDAANELSQNPQDLAARRVFLEMSGSLADSFNGIAAALTDARNLTDQEVRATVDEINRLAAEVADLNGAIVRAEVGGTVDGDANDLRDKRDLRVRRLAELLDLRVVEQKNGAVDVVTSGAFLVRNFTAFGLEMDVVADRGTRISTVRFAENGQSFSPKGGALGGLLQARDVTLTGFRHELDEMARAVMTRVNELHTGGRALQPMRSLESLAFAAPQALGGAPVAVNAAITQTSESGSFVVAPLLKGYPASTPGGRADFFAGSRVLFTSGERAGESALIREYDPLTGRLALDPPMAGIAKGDQFQVTSLLHPVRHGSFELVVHNSATNESNSFNIELDLDGLPTPPATDDTTLREVVDDINAQLEQFYGAPAPVTARITQDMRLEIVSTQADTDFRFASDTSGFLAAAGLNVLFDGSDAGSIAVAARLQGHPERLAISATDDPGDNSIALAIAAFQNERVMAAGTATVEEFYQGVVGALGVQSAEARELAENQDTIRAALESERAAISGVNLDEEAVSLMAHQRAFQAAARYLGVVDELLASLIQNL